MYSRQKMVAASQPLAVSTAMRVWKSPEENRMPRAQKPSREADMGPLVQMVTTIMLSSTTAASTKVSRALGYFCPSQ